MSDEPDPLHAATTRADLLAAWRAREVALRARLLAPGAVLAVRRLPLLMAVVSLLAVVPAEPMAVAIALEILTWWATARFLPGGRIVRHLAGAAAALVAAVGYLLLPGADTSAVAEPVAAALGVLTVGLCLSSMIRDVREQVAVRRELEDGLQQLRRPAARDLPPGGVGRHDGEVHDLRDDPDGLLAADGPLARAHARIAPPAAAVVALLGVLAGTATMLMGSLPFVAGPANLVAAAVAAGAVALGLVVLLWAALFSSLVLPWSMNRELGRSRVEAEVHLARVAVARGQERPAVRHGPAPRVAVVAMLLVGTGLLVARLVLDPTVGIVVGAVGLAVVVAAVVTVVAVRARATRTMPLHGRCDDVRGLPSTRVELVLDDAVLTVRPTAGTVLRGASIALRWWR